MQTYTCISCKKVFAIRFTPDTPLQFCSPKCLEDWSRYHEPSFKVTVMQIANEDS